MFNPLTIVYLIVPLAVGVSGGYLLRNRKVPKLEKLSVAIIIILIFSLGFGIGSNSELIAALPQVGLQALVLATLAIIFSIAFVKAGRKLVKSA